MALPQLPSAPPFPAAVAARLDAARAHTSPGCPPARKRDADGSPRYTNRLALESSPYLLAHAHNPVNWYPWGDEAFAEARRLNRPVFLSIGYSTCHWCHVMEEESFEDEAIAAYLNAHYLPIKVDREERPDIDGIYIRAAERLTGGAGWPLSVWLTDERQPFFAGTYFPPRAGARGAQVGFIEILNAMVRFYREQPERVQEAARALSDAVRTEVEGRARHGREDGRAAPSGSDSAPGRHLDLIARTVEQCALVFDHAYGGMRTNQKFPSHVPIRLLLRHAQRRRDPRALTMAVATLDAMARGGIYDHLVGGFHRYATDPRWLVPHFEKMLYDNALLLPAYAEAWQVTKNEQLLRVVRETCDELLATFAAPEGGFFSATDADSEGEEGKYFVWTEAELRDVLGPGQDTELFLRHYGVTEAGNFEGRNILHEAREDETMVRHLAGARRRLAEARARRVQPLRDEKILAAWNGFAISGFASAGWVTGEQRYLEAARRAASFVCERMRDPGTGRLARSAREGRLGALGFLSDHAALAAGCLDLFEASGEARWLDEALRLCRETEQLFADEAGGWFATSPEHERLLAREKPSHDGAEPSGASLALLNAARLAVLTDDKAWHDIAQRGLASMLPMLEAEPSAMSTALLAVDFMAGPVSEIAVLGSQAELAATPLVRALQTSFCPRKVVVMADPSSVEWDTLAARLPLLSGRVAVDGQATAYVCEHGRCQLPTRDAGELERQLAALSPGPGFA